MKKSLLDEETVDELLARVEKLSPDANSHWGKMNATEMLLHCTLANTFILEDESVYRKPTLKEKLIRALAFNLLSKIPRNNRGPKRLETKGKISSADFELQRRKYIATIKRFPRHDKPFASLHPKMGFLNNEQWGKFAWVHMDHHLRQFGV
jgi:hypothetical protein